LKAILFHNHGDTGVLEYSDYSTPDPGPGQVQVRLKAAVLKRLDLWVREGWPGLELGYPHIPRAEGTAQKRLAGSEQMGKITLAIA